jgi:hypothetical protein
MRAMLTSGLLPGNQAGRTERHADIRYRFCLHSGMQPRFRTMDHRMETFVALFGGLPHEARRLQDFECREHSACWIRRLLGKGIAGNYVIAYVHGDDWCTLCFDRQTTEEYAHEEDEVWLIERYDSSGASSSEIFHYVPDAGRWYRPRRSSDASHDPDQSSPARPAQHS